MHAAHPAQRIAQLVEADGGALDQQHLKRLVVLEKHVLRGDDLLQIFGLGLRELMAHPAPVAAIDDGQRAREHLVGPRRRLVRGERMADQLCNQLRARGQPAFLDHHVELTEQLARQAHR